jgi:hypothetical protein
LIAISLRRDGDAASNVQRRWLTLSMAIHRE